MDENGLGKIGENMKSMLHNEEASARSDAGIVAMSMFFAGLLIVAFTTSPIASGTQVGERAPIFSGEAYDGSSWKSFEFEDLLDLSWTWNSTISARDESETNSTAIAMKITSGPIHCSAL